MNKLIAVALGALFFLSALPAHAAADPSSVLEATLDNGMRVIVVTNRLAPVVTTSLTYGVGGNDDTIPGIAHATEHMMFRGTRDVSSDQFANIATRIGAQYNAETTNMTTRYYFTVPSSYLDVVLHLEADRMQHASMAQADWANERGAIEQEVKAHLSNPLLPIGKRISTVFFGDSPWGRDPVGSIEGFDKMSAADIASFYHTWYHPNNATLVVAGDVDGAKTLESVRSLFGNIASAAVPQHPGLAAVPLPSTTLRETLDFPIPLAIVALRSPGFEDPDYAATQVLFTALNSKRGALADLQLSGKALFAAAIATAYPTGGASFLMTGLRPGSKPESSLADLDALIAQYAKDGVPPELIEASKARILAEKAYEAASIPGQAEEWSAAQSIEHRTPSELFAMFDSVTPADVNRAFKKYLVDGNHVTVALEPKPGASIPHTENLRAGENVKVSATKSVAPPSWTARYFSAPLRAPRDEDRATVFRLKNGMRVAVRRESFSPTVVIDGRIRTNTDLNEPKGKEGVADLTDSLLSLGTTAHDVKAYQGELDEIAASIDLGSSFSAEARAVDFDRTVALLAEGMLHPAFPAAQFTIVSNNKAQSQKAFEDRPESKAEVAKLYALYPAGDPHRRHATSASIAAVDLNDVKRWYAFAYRPDLTTVSVVGDVSPSAVRAAFEKYFGNWTATGRRPNFVYPDIRRKNEQTSTTITSTTSKQATVTLSQRLSLRRGDPDVVALQLANTMLSGEGTGSMLFHDVRKTKGYVYSIDSELRVGEGSSTFEMSYAADPKNVDPAQRAAAQTLQRLRAFPPDASDLALAKAMLLSSYIVSLDTYASVAHQLLRSTEEGIDSNDVSHYYGRVLSTTPEDVHRAMQRWVDPSKFTRVIVAPAGP